MEFTQARKESNRAMNELEGLFLNAISDVRKRHKKLYYAEINNVLTRMLQNNISEEIKDIFNRKKR